MNDWYQWMLLFGEIFTRNHESFLLWPNHKSNIHNLLHVQFECTVWQLSHRQTYNDLHIWFKVLDDSGHASEQPSPSHGNDYGIWLHPQLVHLFHHLKSSSALSCQDVQIIVAGEERGRETLCFALYSLVNSLYKTPQMEHNAQYLNIMHTPIHILLHLCYFSGILLCFLNVFAMNNCLSTILSAPRHLVCIHSASNDYTSHVHVVCSDWD